MLKLLHQGNVFAPEPMGKKDILILDSKIGAICGPDQIKTELHDFSVSGSTCKGGYQWN
jgi:hypothetical protein